MTAWKVLFFEGGLWREDGGERAKLVYELRGGHLGKFASLSIVNRIGYLHRNTGSSKMYPSFVLPDSSRFTSTTAPPSPSAPAQQLLTLSKLTPNPTSTIFPFEVSTSRPILPSSPETQFATIFHPPSLLFAGFRPNLREVVFKGAVYFNSDSIQRASRRLSFSQS